MAARHALSIGLILDSCFGSLAPKDSFSIPKLGFGLDQPLDAGDLLKLQTLQSCMLVNTQWFKHASEILWQNPIPRALTSIEPERRQLYADKIRSLNFSEDDDEVHYDSTMDGLHFPRLERLHISSLLRREELAILTPYLQPRLRFIQILGGWIESTSLLDGLTNRCSSLRHLLLTNMASGKPSQSWLDADDLSRLLQGLPKLESIVLGIGSDKAVTPRVIAQLATRSDLSKLALGNAFTRDMLTGIKELLTPFQNLRGLSGSIDSEDIPLLMETISSVRKLRLVVSGDAKTLSTISDLQWLEDLEIRRSWKSGTSIDPSDVLQLLHLLQNIRAFTIGAKGCQLPNDLLGRVAKEKPLLQELHIIYNDFVLDDLSPVFESASQLHTLEVANISLRSSPDAETGPDHFHTLILTMLALLKLFPDLKTLALRKYENHNLQPDVHFVFLRMRAKVCDTNERREQLNAQESFEWIEELRREVLNAGGFHSRFWRQEDAEL